MLSYMESQTFPYLITKKKKCLPYFKMAIRNLLSHMQTLQKTHLVQKEN